MGSQKGGKNEEFVKLSLNEIWSVMNDILCEIKWSLYENTVTITLLKCEKNAMKKVLIFGGP